MSNKRSADKLSEHGAKKARKSITLAKKMEVIQRMEDGQTRPKVCKSMNLPPSTVTTIMKNAHRIKESAQQATAMTATQVSYTRSKIFEKMEKLLSLWVNDLNQKNIPLTRAVITEKAKMIFENLKKTEGSEETFLGSKGWFMRYKSRSKCHSVKLCDEASEDVAAAAAFSKELQSCVEQGNYPPDLIFNVYETGLYWKIISEEESSTPGFKTAKDRVTLLLAANVSGTLKLKPMLVYHSQTPHAFKGLNKEMLPVYWKWNKKAWVTQDVFKDWYTNYFCPTVLCFCKKNDLPLKAILLLDNAPGHPQNLAEEETPVDVKVVYMPANTTSLLQPMDQEVIATFKAYYLRTTFMEMVRVLDCTEKTIKDFCQSYDILKGIYNIKAAWDEVSAKCLNGVWHKLLPMFMHDEEDFEHVENVVEDVSRLARDVGLDNVTAEDVKEVLQSHNEPLSNEELEELANELSHQYSEEEKEKEELLRVIKTADLERILSTIETMTDELCEIDHDWERSSIVKRSVIGSIQPYYELLKDGKRKLKQLTLDTFFKRDISSLKLETST